jgi:hypothetical protein
LPGGPGIAAIRGGIDSKELIPPLIDALKDSDTEVRRSAAGALAHLGQPAVAALVDVLKDKDKDKELRANAAYVLGQMGTGGQEAVPTLVKLLKDDDRDVRRRAAYAIQNIVRASGESGGMMMPPGGPGGLAPGFPGGGGVGGFGGGTIRGGAAPSVRVLDPGVVPPGGGTDNPVPVNRGDPELRSAPEKKDVNKEDKKDEKPKEEKKEDKK